MIGVQCYKGERGKEREREREKPMCVGQTKGQSPDNWQRGRGRAERERERSDQPTGDLLQLNADALHWICNHLTTCVTLHGKWATRQHAAFHCNGCEWQRASLLFSLSVSPHKWHNKASFSCATVDNCTWALVLQRKWCTFLEGPLARDDGLSPRHNKMSWVSDTQFDYCWVDLWEREARTMLS